MTLTVTLSLTIYAWKSTTDFTVKGGIIWILIGVLFIMSIISWFNTSMILGVLISGVTVCIYGFFLIYDTQLIIGGKV